MWERRLLRQSTGLTISHHAEARPKHTFSTRPLQYSASPQPRRYAEQTYLEYLSVQVRSLLLALGAAWSLYIGVGGGCAATKPHISSWGNCVHTHNGHQCTLLIR